MIARIASWTVGVLLGLMYAYLVVAAVGNLTGLSEMAGGMGLSLTGTGWAWLISGIALPAVVAVIALLLGRGRRAGSRLLLLATGIAFVAAVQLEILHLVPQSTFFA